MAVKPPADYEDEEELLARPIRYSLDLEPDEYAALWPPVDTKESLAVIRRITAGEATRNPQRSLVQEEARA